MAISLCVRGNPGNMEGNVKWMTLDEMPDGKLALNMPQYLAVFQNETSPKPTAFPAGGEFSG